MAPTYAGILGPLAFCMVVARGLIDGSDFAATMNLASLSLFSFAAVGYLVGRLAGWTVLESVQAKLNTELALHQSQDQAEPKHEV